MFKPICNNSLKIFQTKKSNGSDLHAHWNYFSMIPYHMYMYVLILNTKCRTVHISNLDRTKYVFKQFIIN